jgi:hypothetical protein
MDDMRAPGGRTKVFNVTNRVFTTEPFTVTTKRIRPFGRVPSLLRVYLTGAPSFIFDGLATASIRIGAFNTITVPLVSNFVMVDPGVFTLDFELPPEVEGAGDQPIVLTVTVDGTTFSSRLDDTATQFGIL